MKQLPLLIATLTLTAIGCSKQENLYDESYVNKTNAEQVLGKIDPQHDWCSTVKGSITVVADADLDDIVKVQILTASPFFNEDALVLNEVSAKKGSRVTINYDAPSTYSKLVAACVSSKNTYYIQVFKVGQSEVSFAKTSKSRSTRAAASEVPHFTSIVLKAPQKSFNAMRAEQGDVCFIKNDKNVNVSYTEWKDSKWINERMWEPADGNTFDGGWKMDTEKNKGVIYRDIDGFGEGEKETLEEIINSFLVRKANDAYSVNGKKNNIRLIRNSAYFNLNKNYLYTDGENPVTLIPIQAATNQFKMNHVFYYYYKEENIPAGMDETDYIKQLPKFKAIQIERVQTSTDMQKAAIFRNKEFLLPFYGDGIPVEGENAASPIFPKGYKIGFLNMKHDNGNYDYTKCLYGCTYGDGRLNYEVNHIKGHYNTAMDPSCGGLTNEGMTYTDPRIAVFTANGKTYLCFEDGADCNFGDMIIEVAGGTDIIEEEIEPKGVIYTMCFEDRPAKADYDMNDAVIQARIVDKTHVEISLIAAGGYDALFLHGIDGKKLNDRTEIHAIFGLSTTDQFVNTTSGTRIDPVVEVVEKGESETLEERLSRIWVENKSSGQNITINREKGEAPNAIIVPIDFAYPMEKIGITYAYKQFINWARDSKTDTDWYLKPESGKIISRE